MDLMNLVAKMTLDASEYETQLAALLKNPPPNMPEVKVIPAWDEEGLRNFIETAQSNKDLTVAPKVNTKEYKQGLEEATEETNWFKEVMTGVWQGLKDALVAVGITGVITGVINYMRQGVALAAKNGDAIEKGAKNLQISTRAYQEYEYALGKSNIQMSEMRQVMLQIDKIRAGDDSKKGYLEKLGIDAEEATSGLMSAEQLLDGIMSGIADYKGADKGAIIDAFFGSGTKWKGYFDQTSKEIDGLKKEAEDIGYIMSDEGIKNAKEYQDATEKLGQRLEAIQRGFGEGILPIITQAVNKLMMIVDFFTGQDKRTSSEKFADLESKYQSQLSDIRAEGIAAKTIAQQLFNMGDTSKMDARDLAIWKGTAEQLVTMIPTLSGVIDVENGTINDSIDGISELINQYTELKKATAYQTNEAERQAVLNQKENELVEKATSANKKLAEAEGKRSEIIKELNDMIAAGTGRGTPGGTLSYYGIDEVTAENYDEAIGVVLNHMNPYTYRDLQERIRSVTGLFNSANTMRDDMEGLSADIEEGKTNLAEWGAEQSESLGVTSESAQAATEAVDGLNTAISETPTDVYTTFHIDTDGEKPDGFAKGSWNVPYDMPAYLHRDEMVLTKSQARKYRDGGGDVDYGVISQMIGDSLERAMNRVKVLLDGNKVGDMTTRRTNKNIRRRETAVLHGMGG